ncbi:hypothetical protein JK628_20355 [Shewanella sp. KX20019]|uniref:hypothetical protein n=1 Tax=Shewanella sp. KX20019 TaxID=2803864 RepID=UPI0019252AB3|nr:hypothetical protein [Shewanella sp. KX20019]QQX79829.1 hypothetical protein JK628_20355 [Shewanella sp. KX20019]
MKIEVFKADYLNQQQTKNIGYLLNSYAEDPMGGGAPLSAFVKDYLAAKLL